MGYDSETCECSSSRQGCEEMSFIRVAADWAKVTYDASAAGGAAPACVSNVRAAWTAISAAAQTPAGLANLTSTFQMCTPLTDAADVFALEIFHLNAWDTMAMGNYPYSSSYLTGGAAMLPPYPVRAACDFLADPALASGDPWALLSAFNAAGAVFNNATQNLACYPIPTDLWQDGQWDYQYCTELMPEETYFTRDGVNDMFPPFAINESATTAHCLDAWGVRPRFDWMKQSCGSLFLGTGTRNPGVHPDLSPSLPFLLTRRRCEFHWVEYRVLQRRVRPVEHGRRQLDVDPDPCDRLHRRCRPSRRWVPLES